MYLKDNMFIMLFSFKNKWLNQKYLVRKEKKKKLHLIFMQLMIS